jgi:hypothetical protein
MAKKPDSIDVKVTSEQVGVAVDTALKRLIPFGDAIIYNLDMVQQGRRDQYALARAIEAWQKQTERLR